MEFLKKRNVVANNGDFLGIRGFELIQVLIAAFVWLFCDCSKKKDFIYFWKSGILKKIIFEFYKKRNGVTSDGYFVGLWCFELIIDFCCW